MTERLDIGAVRSRWNSVHIGQPHTVCKQDVDELAAALEAAQQQLADVEKALREIQKLLPMYGLGVSPLADKVAAALSAGEQED